MGYVFLADQLVLERTVAIKVLHPELTDWTRHARRIRDEAVAACRVRNPHCVVVIDCGVLPEGAPYIVMEHVPGRSLARIIAEQAIPLARAVDLFDQILSALGAAHDSGIVHADVKSDNFLVEVAGGDHVTMIDFGLARVAGAPAWVDLDGEAVISGTPEYMAPEVIAGDPPLAASDLYGAGAILYELLTGALPFSGGTAAEIMFRHAHDAVVPPSLRRPDRDLPPALDRVVVRALAKRPEARFSDAAAFARELRAAVDDTSRASASTPLRVDDSATPDAPTRSFGTPRPQLPIARGSDRGAGRAEPVDELRAMIGEARVRGDAARIASGYLALARALGSERRFTAAARELQEGIDVLTAGRGPEHPPPPVDRLVAALAALYERAGDRQLARRVAAIGDRCPTLTGAAS